MSRNCAIIVCDHGLGHVRRCALIAKEREKLGDLVTIFAPLTAVERLQRAVPSVAGLNVYDFATHTSPERIRLGLRESVEWLDNLPALDNFDSVICDNLPELLKIRPDAMLSANFFWHDVIVGAADDYIQFCENLLSLHKPIIIGCDQFAMEHVRNQVNFRSVALYKVPELVAAAADVTSDQRTDLLVTGGTTPAVHKQLQEIVQKLLDTGPKTYIHVHVDSELMPSNPPPWMSIACFSPAMYCRIKTAICRPGLGVISDLLTVGAEIIPVFEIQNKEMSHNAKILESISKHGPLMP